MPLRRSAILRGMKALKVEQNSWFKLQWSNNFYSIILPRFSSHPFFAATGLRVRTRRRTSTMNQIVSTIDEIAIDFIKYFVHQCDTFISETSLWFRPSINRTTIILYLSCHRPLISSIWHRHFGFRRKTNRTERSRPRFDNSIVDEGIILLGSWIFV